MVKIARMDAALVVTIVMALVGLGVALIDPRGLRAVGFLLVAAAFLVIGIWTWPRQPFGIRSPLYRKGPYSSTEAEAGTDPLGDELLLHDKDIRFGDLRFPSPAVIEGRTFDHCRLFGPAVINLHQCLIVNSNFVPFVRDDLESILIEVPEGKPLGGAARFKRCAFQNCLFDLVSLIGTKESLDDVRKLTPAPLAWPVR